MRRSGTSIATSNHYLRALKNFANFMVRTGSAVESPVAYLRLLNEKTDRRRIRRVLAVQEIRKLLKMTAKSQKHHGLTGFQRRLLDLLDGLKFVRPGGYGVIGNSLGGRMAIFLAAFDERIACGVPSCGISPNLTNVYRAVSGHPASKSSPRWLERLQRCGGHTSYDYQDMIALCAPRALLLLEPYNDAYNPYVEANFRCYVAGQRVYRLLGKPERFCTLTHGDGHDTVDDVREFAYRWFERWLTP